MEDVKLVIFDMDGLMTDTERVGWKALEAVMARYGVRLGFETYRTVIGTTQPCVDALFRREFGDDFPVERFNREVAAEKRLLLRTNGVPLKPGLWELLYALEARGIRRVVATSSERAVLKELLTENGVLAHFDGTVCGDEVTHSKPHPEIFQRAARGMETVPRHALVLEDSVNGIKAAHNGGFRCVFIPDLLTPPAEVLAWTWAQVKSLADVIGLLPDGTQ